MNNDLISREALKKVIETYRPTLLISDYLDGKNRMVDYCISEIDNAPPVELVIGRMVNGVIIPIKRPQGEWTPVSEKLPDDLEPVNITWINHDPEPYYKEIKDKPFTATGVYFNGQWYWWSTLCTDMLAEYSHNYSDVIDDDIEIIAWQPLPEPYKKGGAE